MLRLWFAVQFRYGNLSLQIQNPMPETADRVQAAGEPITVTKHGKPVARLVPVEQQAPSMFGCMKGTVTILGDIMEPIDVEWDALKE